MKCNDITSCFAEINTYCSGAPTGYALLVNTENYNFFQSILTQMRADSSKKIIYVSDYCINNKLPKIQEIDIETKGSQCYVLVGISQFEMLCGARKLEQSISALLNLPVRGHLVVLLEHSHLTLSSFIKKDHRLDRRIILGGGEKSPLPNIRLVKNEKDCIGQTPKANMKELLAYLEKISDEMLEKSSEITAVLPFSLKIFEDSLYSISECDDVYNMLKKTYSDISAGTKKDYGTEEQWRDLACKMVEYKTFSGLINHMFGTVTNLASHISDKIATPDSLHFWYLWLGMKVLGVNGQQYLADVIKTTNCVEELEKCVYMNLLDYKYTDSSFKNLYDERKRLIGGFIEKSQFLSLYCNRVRQHEKSAVYYLTDASEEEEYEFVRCLSIYDYTEEEILNATVMTFPEIHIYLQDFIFSESNFKLADKDCALRNYFSDYFKKYKLQKVTNRIYEDFLLEIEKTAVDRPYNLVQNRISVLKKKVNPKSQIFFFDALGVEYLSYIQDKSAKYGMICEIQIARCELPSITKNNKEFTKIFPDRVLKIEALDDLKHHSQIIDYTKSKEPIHLFRELEIIDNQLHKIQSALLQDHYENAVIVSDHGASRLAVIYEKESNSGIKLEERGKYSGRCSPSEYDPQIPFITHEDGYAVLANYERFEGGRAANVEVHGGATLEEVLVPIIVLSKRPEELYISFTDAVVEIKPKEFAKITVFSNVPLEKPFLHLNGKIYEGTFKKDKQHVEFSMPDIKRSRSCVADVYDGDKKMASELTFRVQTTVAKTNDRMSI